MAKRLKNQAYRGFSLVELAVSLVIIGLLMGLVVGGASLVQDVKVKNVMSEIRQYDQAVAGFKDKFKYYPGDYASASQYWAGAQDGDGDWLIEDDSTERLYAWNHLANAGMLEGAYTGMDAGTPDYQADVNLPDSAIDGNHYMVGTNIDGQEIFGKTGAALSYGSNASMTDPYGGALVAKNAYYIDSKMDDGVANTGRIYGVDGNGVATGECSAPADEAGTDYHLDETVTGCRLVWWLDF